MFQGSSTIRGSTLYKMTPKPPQANPTTVPGDSDGEQSRQTVAQLFRDCDRALRSFLMARLGSEHEAQEVAQEAYARLLQLHQPDVFSHPRAYLFKIAANVATDRMRQRVTRARVDQLDVDGFSEPVETASPDRRALAKEQLDLVERALGELPPKYRQAFLLNRFENWTTTQIAVELLVQERMVRNYIGRTAIYCQLRLDGVSRSKAWQEVMP